MGLYAYQQQTELLLSDVRQLTFNTGDLQTWINIARRQLAGEAACIRRIGSLALVASQQVYNFSSITISDSTGIGNVLNVRTAWIVAGSGQLWIRPRSFKWFSLYELNNSNPQEARPEVWAQFGQGVSGTIYFSNVPDSDYTVNLDCTCLPINLASNTDTETIPDLWTDAIPYFAAYLAVLSSQIPNRHDMAQKFMDLYMEFTGRARRFATPDVLPGIYDQTSNVTRQNQLGLRPVRAQGV